MHSKNNVHTVIYCIESIVVSNVPNSSTYSTILPLKYQDTLVSIIYGTICNVLIDGPVPLSWEIAAMLAKVVVVGVHHIVARGAQDLTNFSIL